MTTQFILSQDQKVLTVKEFFIGFTSDSYSKMKTQTQIIRNNFGLSEWVDKDYIKSHSAMNVKKFNIDHSMASSRFISAAFSTLVGLFKTLYHRQWRIWSGHRKWKVSDYSVISSC